MLVDWLIYGLLVFGIAKLLNAAFFKLKPASRPVAWGLTILVFIFSVAVHTALKALRLQAISDSVGVSINAPNSLDFTNAFISAWLFFILLNRKEAIDKSLSNITSSASVKPPFSNSQLETPLPSFSSELTCASCKSSTPEPATFCRKCGAKLGPEPKSSEPIAELSLEQKMAQFDITHDGIKYCFQSYKYDRLQDAINYASQQRAKATTYKCK